MFKSRSDNIFFKKKQIIITLIFLNFVYFIIDITNLIFKKTNENK